MAKKTTLTELEALHNLLVPVLARATLGDFSSRVELSANQPEAANDLIMGVNVLLEVIQEKIEELELANAALEEAHGRSLTVLDDVLRKSLEAKSQLL
jgi:hypothetical protein